MKTKTTLTALALAALAFSSLPAWAEDAPTPSPAGEVKADGPQGGPMGGPQGNMEGDNKGGPRVDRDGRAPGERFQKTDADHDGYLSKEEMEEEHQARFNDFFNSTDADHDGKLSPEELKNGREAMREKFKEKMKERRDERDDKGDRFEGMRERMQQGAPAADQKPADN